MDSDSANSRFLTAVGHDLRQPLHALLLYLAALERRIKDEDAREVLGKADRAAQTLADMIEALIQLARLDAGKTEPDLERVSLEALFDDLLERTPYATADKMNLYVHSDPGLLDAIMQQLLSNAATHGGGKAHISARATNGAVEISVRDAGAGIAPENHARIFEEFTRLEGASATGLGIGLTIAQKLATLLKHDIEVHSAPGEGAEFIIRAASA